MEDKLTWHHHAKRHWRRIWRVGLGSIVVIIGLILVPLPGPGWLVVIAGLAIMADEVPLARRILDYLKARLEQVEDKVLKRKKSSDHVGD